MNATSHTSVPGSSMSQNELLELLMSVPESEILDVLDQFPPQVQAQMIDLIESATSAHTHEVLPATVIEHAQLLEPTFLTRPHLTYLSDRLQSALHRVENGESVHMTVSMPPRSGKSFTISTFSPNWFLSLHPDWKAGLISHSPTLANSWGRANRRIIEEHGAGETASGKLPTLELARDARAVSHWETTAGGYLLSRSVRQALAGFGFKVLIVDDPVKDIASVSSQKYRDDMWEWWKADVVSRMQAPYLLIVVGTRWHEDDLIGRILSSEYEGDPDEWEQIVFPAIATENTVDPITGVDIIGRRPGDPLISPLIPDETRDEALVRWHKLEKTVGSYYWSALYQQRPTPESGGILQVDKIKFWTTDIDLMPRTESGTIDHSANVRLLTEEDMPALASGRWIDSWDTSFKGKETSDYAVGQRWVKVKADRYLIAQQRGQWGYTDTLEAMKKWADPGVPSLAVGVSGSPFGQYVYERVIEETANGPALIEEMSKIVSGVKGINPHMGKEARARVITPEIESGNVYLPHPQQPGFEWVTSLLSEIRNFPRDKHDDQVDAMTQALGQLRDAEVLAPASPVSSAARIQRNYLTPSGQTSRYTSGGSSYTSQRRIPGR